MDPLTLTVGILGGVALTLFAFVLASELGKLRLNPPADAGAIPLTHQQGFGRT
jgi:hypothetical protein